MNELEKRANEIVGAFRPAPKARISVFRGEEANTEYARLNDKYGRGLTTGYDELDEFFTFIPQQLYLISAATHVGKTTLALNLCARIASLGKRVLFCSLEQGVFVAPRIEKMVGEIPETFSLLTSDDLLSVKEIITFISGMDQKPDLVCIDHLHFIKKAGNKTTADIDQMIIEIQNMAKQLELPVIVISHVRKLNDDKVPNLDDLRDSSSLAQVPSVVVFLHRKRNEESVDKPILSDHGLLTIAKNRIQGKSGAIGFTLLGSGEFVFSWPTRCWLTR